MKRHFAPLFVLAAGCAVDTNLDDTSVVESPAISGTPKGGGCPDPYTCDPGNGGGVYTEENGFAGIGPNAFLITHFINNSGANVSLSGRRYNWGTHAYQVDSGQVKSAWYHGVHYYSVLSVSEDLTKPTWKLGDPANPVVVSGDQIKSTSSVAGLLLEVELNDGTENKSYTLVFNTYTTDAPSAADHTKVAIDKANMGWKVTGSSSLFQQYCWDASNQPDAVVFQEGFAVNAVNADFTANSAFVTMSCRAGGPAVVRSWGYTYGTATTDRFQAALHMKRASYCGDKRYFTVTGTHIKIYDAAVKQNDIAGANPAAIEAVWNRDGAICVNLTKLRNIGGTVAVWPSMGGSKFDGYCANYSTPDLPACDATHLTSSSLVLASEQSP